MDTIKHNTKAIFHSEPDKNVKRFFLQILSGNKSEINSFKGRRQPKRKLSNSKSPVKFKKKKI